MAVAAQVEGGGGGGSSHLLRRALMYQSVQGFCPFKRAAARRINEKGGGGGKVIVIANTPKLSPKTDLSLHTKKPTTR